MKIENLKILIIGGRSGLGFGIAKVCADYGARITIASRDENKLRKAATALGNDTKYEVVDILSGTSISKLFENVGSIDHLVLTSGFVTGKQFHELSENDARNDFEVNFWGKFKVAKQASEYINKNGSITFISGAFAKKPNPNAFMTSVSVSAVETMVKVLTVSLSPVRVNALAPYVVDTASVDSEEVSEDRKRFLASAASNLPSKCVGMPENIGDAAVFLISNPYVTGSILSIDGGFTVIY